MENAGGLGRYLAERLAGSGESVVDVPPKLSARVRVLSTGNARKNDGLDALATALAASRQERLAAVDHGTASEVLRLSIREARRPGSRAHPGAQPPPRSSTRPRPGRGGRNAFGPPCRTRPARHTSPGRPVSRPAPTGFSGPARRPELDRKIADLNERIEAELEPSGTALTEIFGVGPILAARIIGTVGDVGRFPTKAHFASYSGTAPVEASSGEKVRHRLSLAGNRKLNYCLHMVAVCQARSDARGGTYYRKKMAEGKSRKEALRCLKRRISDAVFKSLVADSRAPSRSAA